MFFLNLSAFEFFALLGTLSSVITALYLLDRRKRKRVVSTLRFWTAAAGVDERRSKHHMRQPWSLLLQLLSLVLLLLAIADLQWGDRPARSSDHVLLLDTSAWAGAKLPSGVSVLDEERRLARAFLRSLPASDRVSIVSTDALASPAGQFTSERKKWNAMLAAAIAGRTALDLGRAISFAQNAQKWSGGSAGEIVYVGPARGNEDIPSPPGNLRVIAVTAPRENIGIRSAAAQSSDGSPDSWSASFVLSNDGSQPHTVELRTSFAGTNFAARSYALHPKSQLAANYTFVTRTAGTLEAALTTDGDALASDNRVQLALPGNAPVRVAALTRRRSLLEPLLSADSKLSVQYFDPSQYRAKMPADLFVFDEFAPAQRPSVPSLWLHPPRSGSPLPVKTSVRNASLAEWNTAAFGDTGLHARELRFDEAEVFQTLEGDTAIATLPEGPVVVARNDRSGGRAIFVGYDVLSGASRTDLTTPLLFANILAWLAPEAFRTESFGAEQVGAASLRLEAGEKAEALRITDETGTAVPFSASGGSIQLFVEHPRLLRLNFGNHSRSVSLTLPNVSGNQWTPPSSVRTGVPQTSRLAPSSASLWKWLAVSGGLGLLLEWILFGRTRRIAFRQRSSQDSVAKEYAGA